MPYGPGSEHRNEAAEGPGGGEHDFYGRGLQSSVNDIMVGEEDQFAAGLLMGSDQRDGGDMGSGLEGGTIEREIDVQNVDSASEIRHRGPSSGIQSFQCFDRLNNHLNNNGEGDDDNDENGGDTENLRVGGGHHGGQGGYGGFHGAESPSFYTPNPNNRGAGGANGRDGRDQAFNNLANVANQFQYRFYSFMEN